MGMRWVEINWSPSERQLRQFGWISLVAFPLLGWIWSASQQTQFWLVGLGVGLAGTGVMVPRALKPVFVGLMLLALPIGMVISEVAMVLIYIGVFFPISLCFRLARRDALKRVLDRSRSSYWEAKRPPKDVSRYYRQW